MRRGAIHGQRCGWGACSLAFAAFGLLGGTSCLVPKDDYCAFDYGDRSCSAERGLCVLAEERASHEDIQDGCSAEVPEGFVHVAYGLPITVAATAGRPEAPTSVQGVLATKLQDEGYEGCGTLDGLEARFGQLVVGVAEVRRHLTEHGRVRRAAVSLKREHVDAIEAFNEAVDAWVAECTQVGADTETVGTTTDVGEAGSETSATSSTTGEEPCVDDDDCRMRDPSLPFCDPSTMKCVDCGGVPVGACAAVDPLVPVCEGGVCVACVEGNTAACDEQLLVCDAEQRACVPCSAHEQCEAGACDLLADTPTCFEPGNVLNVGMGQTHATIGAALTAVDAMMLDRAVLRLHDGADFNEVATVDGRVIAFVPAPGDNPEWIRTTGSTPTLTVTDPETRVYLDQLRLVQNASSNAAGLRCDGGAVYVQRSHIVQNDAGGISASSGCVLQLENTFVGGGGDTDPALTVTGSTVTAVYTTFFNSSFDSTPAIACDVLSTVTLRNSIVVTQGGAAGTELDCPGAEVSFTAMEGVVSGTSNVAVGTFPDGMPTQWFTNVNIGDFHLQNQGLDIFADIAQWNPGDPLTDIDGDPRPTVDGTLDYPGADVP